MVNTHWDWTARWWKRPKFRGFGEKWHSQEDLWLKFICVGTAEKELKLCREFSFCTKVSFCGSRTSCQFYVVLAPALGCLRSMAYRNYSFAFPADTMDICLKWSNIFFQARKESVMQRQRSKISWCNFWDEQLSQNSFRAQQRSFFRPSETCADARKNPSFKPSCAKEKKSSVAVWHPTLCSKKKQESLKVCFLVVPGVLDKW